MNRPRAVFLMVLSLTGTSCLSCAAALTPGRLEPLPGAHHRWSSAQVYRPAQALFARSAYQPQNARSHTAIMRVVAPVRRQNIAPVFVPGGSATMKAVKIGRQTNP